MDLLPTDEQHEIIDAAANLLAKELPITRIRELAGQAGSADARVWSACADLGWFGLAISEDDGGVGYSIVEEALLLREIGRSLAPGPFLSTILGARLAAASGLTDVAAQIMSGSAPVGLAEPRDDAATVGPPVRGGFNVIDGIDVEYLLVATPDGAALVDRGSVGDVEQLPCIDPGVRLGRVVIDGVEPVAFLPVDVEDLFLRGSLLAAAMLTGISEATRDQAAAYAKDRVQFGKPIGVNQAIKHTCADMAMRAEAAWAQLRYAAAALDGARPDAAFHAAAAKTVATEAAVHNAGDNIQVHGGMGYTMEHEANLYLKRAQVLNTCIGDLAQQKARLLSLPPAQ